MNLIEIHDNLKMLSNAQLKQVLGSGSAPAYMVLGEIDRRNKMAQSMGVPSSDMPTASVADDLMNGEAVDTDPGVVINMPAPAAAQGIGALTPQAPAQAPQTGGAQAMQVNAQAPKTFAKGGKVECYAEGGPVATPQGPANPMQDFFTGIMSMMDQRPQRPQWGGDPAAFRTQMQGWGEQMRGWGQRMRDNIHTFRDSFAGGAPRSGFGGGFGGGSGGSGFAGPSWASMLRPTAPAAAGAPAAPAPAYAGGGIIDLLSNVSPLAGLATGRGMMGQVMRNPLSPAALFGLRPEEDKDRDGKKDEPQAFSGGGLTEGENAAGYWIRRMIEGSAPEAHIPINPGNPNDSFITMMGGMRTGEGAAKPSLMGVHPDKRPPVLAKPTGPVAAAVAAGADKGKGVSAPKEEPTGSTDEGGSSFGSTLADVKKAMANEKAAGQDSLADLEGIEGSMMADLAQAKDENAGLTLAQLGFGLASGKSQYFAENLGNAGKEAVERAAQNKHEERGMQKEIYDAQSARIAAKQALAEGDTRRAAQMMELQWKLKNASTRGQLTPGQALTARVNLINSALRNLPEPTAGMADPYAQYRSSMLQELRGLYAQLNGSFSMEALDEAEASKTE